jgi:hypothetical protein
MNKIKKSIAGLLLGQYPKTSQVLQGAMMSGLDRATGSPAPAQYVATYGLVKAGFAYHNKTGEFEMPAWKKMSLYAFGATLPYADKIYCSMAPTIGCLMY